jgi:hypothetical protein
MQITGENIVHVSVSFISISISMNNHNHQENAHQLLILLNPFGTDPSIFDVINSSCFR